MFVSSNASVNKGFRALQRVGTGGLRLASAIVHALKLKASSSDADGRLAMYSRNASILALAFGCFSATF